MSGPSTATKTSLSCAVIGAALLAASPALAQTKDHAPVALPSAQVMAHDSANSESWTYLNPTAVFTKYRTVIVDPGIVYNGPDAQFDGVDPADRSKYATMMSTALQTEINRVFPAPAVAGPDTLRVRLNLLGVQNTKGGIATATRLTPAGFGLSAAKSLLGKQGTFTGSVLYSVEAYDAKSGELLLAAVRRRTPDPLDIPATLSTAATVKSVARDFANSARQRLEGLTQHASGQ